MFEKSHVAASFDGPNDYKHYDVDVMVEDMELIEESDIVHWKNFIDELNDQGKLFLAELRPLTQLGNTFEYVMSDPGLKAAACLDFNLTPIPNSWQTGRRLRRRPVYLYCSNHPHYQAYLRHQVYMMAEAQVDGLMVDDGGGLSFSFRHGGCFGKYCMKRFQEYLRARYTPRQLAEHGIENVDTFDYRQLVLRHALGKWYTPTLGPWSWAGVKTKNLTGLLRLWVAFNYTNGSVLCYPRKGRCMGEETSRWYYPPKEAFEPLYEFARSHPELLDGYEAVEQVGVLSAEHQGEGHLQSNPLKRVCGRLADLNVPFGMVVAGQDRMSERLRSDVIERFELLLLPEPLRLTGAQAEIVETWKARSSAVPVEWEEGFRWARPAACVPRQRQKRVAFPAARSRQQQSAGRVPCREL